MMKAVFRVAVIGCGAISGNHIASILAAEQTICALCDIDPAKAAGRAEEFKLNVPFYTDYIRMLDEIHPDAVHICTPHYLHAPMCIEALQRDIHVLCEKPLCISLEQLASIRKTVGESKAQLGAVLQNRYQPNMIRLKKMAEEGVTAAFGSVVWKRDKAYYESGAWRGTWAEEGGGVMINQALHTLDLMQWICGMPDAVTATISNAHLQGTIEVEDTATAMFETENGTCLNFFATTAGSRSFPVQLRVMLKNKTVINAENNCFTVNGAVADSDAELVTYGKQVWGTGHKALIREFYSCLAEGKPFPINAEEGAKVVRLILAMYQSNDTRIAIPK